MNQRPLEVLVDVFKITEMRDGCIYKTEYVGRKWIPMEDREKRVEDHVYASIADATIVTIRRRP